MKIYTRKGDFGKTQILGKDNIDKSDSIIAAYGTIDELNSCLGIVKTKLENDDLKKEIEGIQKDLFTIGIAISGSKQYKKIDNNEVTKLEELIDKMDENLPKLTHFILPGGSEQAVFIHLARAICRRAERKVVEASRDYDISEDVLKYMNRLSDYLFTLARLVNFNKKIKEVEWKGKKLL